MARTSASTSAITLAVIRVPVSSTASVASSSQPIQSPRPVASITTSWVVSVGSRSNLPRFFRSHAHVGLRLILRRIAPWSLR